MGSKFRSLWGLHKKFGVSDPLPPSAAIPLTRGTIVPVPNFLCKASLWAVVVGMFVLLPTMLSATQDSRLSFDVVSIKPSNSSVSGVSQFLPGGKYRGTNVTLKSVIAVAYDILQRQIAGGPTWIDTDRYEINAQPDAGLGIESNRAGVEKTRQMMRSLLVDRFKLTFHTEMLEEPIYALTIAKGGPKLVQAARDEKTCQDVLTTLNCHVFIGGQGRGLDGRTVTLSEVARALATWVDRPVLDRKVIQGVFDINIDS